MTTRVATRNTGYRMSLRELQPLLDYMPSGVAYVKVRYEGGKAVDTFHLYTNHAYDNQAGLTNVVGKWTSEILPDFLSTQADVLEKYGRVGRGGAGEQYETFVASLDKWFRASIYSPKRNHVVAIFDDITPARRHEEEMLAINNRLEAAITGSNLGTWEVDIPNNRITLGKRAAAMVGYPVSAIPSSLTDFLTQIHPDDMAYVKAELRSHIKGATPFVHVENRIRHREGHWCWFRSTGKIAAYDSRGAPTRIVGTVLDISAQRRLSSEGFDLVRRFESMLRDFASSDDNRRNRRANADLLDKLSRRQKQVIVFIAKGLKSAEIAKKLGISLPTVVSHRRVVMQKLKLHSVAAVTRFAMDNGLV